MKSKKDYDSKLEEIRKDYKKSLLKITLRFLRAYARLAKPKQVGRPKKTELGWKAQRKIQREADKAARKAAK